MAENKIARIRAGGARARVLLLMAADALCFVGVWVFTVWAYRAVGLGHYKFGAEFYLRLWPSVLVFIALNALFRLYHGNLLYPAAPISPVEELRRLVGSSAITHVGVIAYLALAYQTTEHYSRAVIVLSGVLTAVLAQPVRDLARALAFRLGIAQVPVVLAGAGASARRVAAALAANAYTGFRIVRIFADDNHAIVPESRKLGVRILLSCQDDRVFRCQMAEFVTWFTHIEYLAGGDAWARCVRRSGCSTKPSPCLRSWSFCRSSC